MKRIIAGGTGFIGRHLIAHWQNDHEIIIIGRDKNKINQAYPKLQGISWDELEANYKEVFANCEIIVNLAGANIGAKLWSKHRKQVILQSRIKTTNALANYCAALGEQSPALFNASAIGTYGLQEHVNTGLPPALTEAASIDFQQAPDFLAEVGRAWELATEPAKQKHVRVINMRFGIVFAKNGGVLSKLALPFKFGLGGKIGSGKQPITWIHITDLLSAIEFIIEHQALKGPINFTAPEAMTQHQFAKALSKALNRPCFMPTPAFALKMLLGQMAEELLLKGQHVAPEKLLNAEFKFKYPTLEAALRNIYS